MEHGTNGARNKSCKEQLDQEKIEHGEMQQRKNGAKKNGARIKWSKEPMDKETNRTWNECSKKQMEQGTNGARNK